jgi:hypothetical protein
MQEREIVAFVLGPGTGFGATYRNAGTLQGFALGSNRVRVCVAGLQSGLDNRARRHP